MGVSSIDRLIDGLRKKEYSIEEPLDKLGRAEISFGIDPEKHQEWKGICFESVTEMFGRALYPVSSSTKCKITYERGELYSIEYEFPDSKFPMVGTFCSVRLPWIEQSSFKEGIDLERVLKIDFL